MRSDLIKVCSPKGLLDRLEVEVLLALACGVVLGMMLGMCIK